MNLKFNISINENNIKTWCSKNGYKIITPLEIILNYLGIKKSSDLMIKLFPDNDDAYDAYARRISKKGLSIKLLYCTEEEQKDIEKKVIELYGCIEYIIVNKLDYINSKWYYKDSDGVLKGQIRHIGLYNLCSVFSHFKIVDGELIEDWNNMKPEVKDLEYYDIKNTLTREIEKLWT